MSLMKNSVDRKRNLTKVFLAVFSLCIGACFADNDKTISKDRYRQIREITSSSANLLTQSPVEYAYEWERQSNDSSTTPSITTKKVHRIDGKDSQGKIARYHASTYSDIDGTSKTEGYLTYKTLTYAFKEENGIKELKPSHQKRIDFDFIKFIIDYPNQVFHKATEPPKIIMEDESHIALNFSFPNEGSSPINLTMTLDKTKNFALKSYITSQDDKVEIENYRKHETLFIPTALTATIPFPNDNKEKESWKIKNISYKILSRQESEDLIKERYRLWGGK